MALYSNVTTSGLRLLSSPVCACIIFHDIRRRRTCHGGRPGAAYHLISRGREFAMKKAIPQHEIVTNLFWISRAFRPAPVFFFLLAIPCDPLPQALHRVIDHPDPSLNRIGNYQTHLAP